MRLFIFAFALTLPFAAMAEAPRYFRTLSPLAIRVDPTADSEEVDALDENVGPLEVTAEHDGWGRVAWRGADGWVRLGDLAPYPVARLDAAAVPVGLACSGTEPFWSLSFTGPATAQYSAPETDAIAYAISESAVAAGRPEFPAGFLLSGRESSAVALIRPLECSDGMSDMTYGWTLDLMTRRDARGEMVLLTGCCRLPIDD